MMNLVKRMRRALSLHDVLLIITIVIFIPWPLAFPLTARVVNRRLKPGLGS